MQVWELMQLLKSIPAGDQVFVGVANSEFVAIEDTEADDDGVRLRGGDAWLYDSEGNEQCTSQSIGEEE
jgi:hypothetical protein